MNGWLVFLVLLAAYIGVLGWLRNRQGKLSGGFELNGPFIMWRTQWGKRWLERIARPAKFWNVVADAGIVLTFAMGALVFALVAFLGVSSILTAFTKPAATAAAAAPPNYLLGIPGVNPIIPIGYGIIAILLALLIHEGSHGVTSYASKMRVKSLGLLFFVVPVGAFVEPDEEDLERSTTRAKNRVFAAGPTSNIVLAIAAGLVLSLVLLPAATPVNGGHGVVIVSVTPDSPAMQAGLHNGDIITRVDANVTSTTGDFFGAMSQYSAGQQVGVDYLRDHAPHHAEVVLADKYDYYAKTTPAQNNDTFHGRGFLGIQSVGLDFIDFTKSLLQHPFSSIGAFLNLILAYPLNIFQGVLPDVFSAPYRDQFDLHGPLSFLPHWAFFGLAGVCYWLIWINVTLATFNALPMGPLDGGQMFRATLRERLMKRYRVDRDQVHVEKGELGGLKLTGRDEQTQTKLDRIQRVTKRVTWTLGFGILGLILVPILVPHVLRLFGY